jgi:hypothetical protein
MSKNRILRLFSMLLIAAQLAACSGIAGTNSQDASSSVGPTTAANSPVSVAETTPSPSAVLPEDDSVTLRMAMGSMHYEVSYYDTLIEDFGRQSGVTIQKEDYGEDASQLMLELAAGDSPDLLMSFWNDGILTEKDCLIDVYAFLDRDPDLQRSDFINLDMLCYGEQLTRISPGYDLKVAFGLEESYSDVDRSNWTLDAFLNRLEQADAPEEMTGNSTGLNFLLNYTLSYASDYVDYEAAACNYQTDAFLGLLHAAAQVDAAYTPDTSGSGDTYSELFREAPELIDEVQLEGVAGYTILQEELVGCSVSFLGYPTSDGGKAQAMFVTPISGCSGTAYPDEVWSFLKYVLTADTVCSDLTIFPVYTPALEQQLTQAVSNYTAKAAPQTQLGFRDALAIMMDLEALEPSFSKESAELLRELLYTGSMYGGYDGVITPIIQEEASAFLSGDQDAEETAALIQSRVSIYLSEQQ